jgi:hypothetical protein
MDDDTHASATGGGGDAPTTIGPAAEQPEPTLAYSDESEEDDPHHPWRRA